jgi:GTP-binding protein HflX
MYEPNSDGRERTLLIGLVVPGLPRPVVEEHLDELERLVDTAGGEVVGREIQERAKPATATLVGRGFLQRIADRCTDEAVVSLVFDEDLTASQVRNIESEIPDEVKVLDRAAVILDILSWHSSATCYRGSLVVGDTSPDRPAASEPAVSVRPSSRSTAG